jgi:GT2 family glycosyltransferase
VYVESDPCQVQVELAQDVQQTVDVLEPHAAFFTFAENLGNADCRLPVSPRFPFVPTRQPVLMDLWDRHGVAAGPRFTTIANWHQPWRSLVVDGQTLLWSKDEQFKRFVDLPQIADAGLELALSNLDADDRALLDRHGWTVRDALEVSRDIDEYRHYVVSSLGEFTVAKEQNVVLRSGWFSDRSATYLAAGRPVITQDTGFGTALPTDEGLFAFTTLEEASGAIEATRANYGRHSKAAWEIAREYFSSDVVLGAMVDHLGIRPPRRGPSRPSGGDATQLDSVVLTPVSRRPLVLSAETSASVLSSPMPEGRGDPLDGPHGQVNARGGVSVVVVTHDNLVCTRLCLESLLAEPAPWLEVVVVDNASTDGTPAYLHRLAEVDPRLTVVTNERNVGFAAAVNGGLRHAVGDFFVLLNDDTVVPDRWLHRLLPHLADPDIGAVGAVTGRIGTAAEVPYDYHTLAEFRSFAARRAHHHRRQTRDVDMLAMFCMALRRGTYERVGPLDESFGLGLFEDDDYAERLRRLGYRLVVAEDVYVHHFGEASFGDLVSTGEYGELFEANRRRFEEKWNLTWHGHAPKHDPRYEAMVDRIRTLVDEVVPASAHVLVITKGDPGLLELGRRADHFPQTASGDHPGFHPATGGEAVEMLGQLRLAGATHLVVPESSRWWLAHYHELAQYLAEEAHPLVESGACCIYAFNRPMVPSTQDLLTQVAP